MFRDNRARPNVLVTGTPGTGKTTLSALVAQRLGMRHVCVGELVKEQNLHDGYDAEYDTHTLNEDKLCDYLEDVMAQGGVVVDFHTVDFFPERWFDLVAVLRCDNDLLYPRLEARGYKTNKIDENVHAEIMQVVLDDARESYDEEIILELSSCAVDDVERNAQTIEQRLRAMAGGAAGGAQ